MGQQNPYQGMADTTTVAVKPETADELHALKNRGESYDDVIQRLLSERGGTDE